MCVLITYLAAFLALLPSCTALLCGPWPLADCIPNCDDGLSYCDLSVEVCMNNFIGGCEDIFWVTIAVTTFYNLIPSTTVYPSTYSSYTTEVYWESTTVVNSGDVTTMVTTAATYTAVETAPASTVTTTVEAKRRLIRRDVTSLTPAVNTIRRLFKRDVTSTVDSMISWDCALYDDPACTTGSVELVWTEYPTWTTTSTYTAYSDEYNSVTYVATDWYTDISTYYPEAVTISVTAEAAEQSSLPEETNPSDPTSESIAEQTTTSGSSNSNAAPTSTFATVIVPTATPNSPGDISALAELQSGVPVTAQNDAAAACFLFTQYSSAYPTPTWYTSLASDAQSLFGSVNAENTAACAPTPTSEPGSPSVGLSTEKKGGIAGGVIAGAALLSGLAYLAYTKFIAPPKAVAKSAPTQFAQDNSGQPWQDNNGQQWQNNSGQPEMSTQPTQNPAGWNGVSGDPSSGGWNGVTGDPSNGGWNGVTGDPSNGGWNGVTGSSPPPGTAPPHPTGGSDSLFLIAGAGRRRRSEEHSRPPPPTHASPTTSTYSVPRRAVPSRTQTDLSGRDPFADSARGTVSPSSELSIGGAVRGQEAGGNERYEVPAPGGAYFSSSETDGRQRYEAPGSRYA